MKKDHKKGYLEKDIRKGFVFNLILGVGGVYSASHVDYFGYSVWLTINEGSVGFGWIDVKNDSLRFPG